MCNYAGATGGGTDSVPAIRFNGDTGTNYSDTILRGDGSSATSGRHSSSSYIQISGSNVSNTAWATFKVDVMNYSNATTNKTAISRNSQSDVVVNSVVGLWRNTAAITSITIILASGTFKIGSTFTLYGILAA